MTSLSWQPGHRSTSPSFAEGSRITIRRQWGQLRLFNRSNDNSVSLAGSEDTYLAIAAI